MAGRIVPSILPAMGRCGHPDRIFYHRTALMAGKTREHEGRNRVRIGCRKCGYFPRLAASRHSKLLKTCSGGGSDINGVQGVGGSNPLVPISYPSFFQILMAKKKSRKKASNSQVADRLRILGHRRIKVRWNCVKVGN